MDYLDIFQSAFRSKYRAEVVLAILLGDLCRDLNRGSMLLLVLLDLSVSGSISGEDGPSEIESSVLAFKHLSPQMAASSLLPSEATTNICLVPACPKRTFSLYDK